MANSNILLSDIYISKKSLYNLNTQLSQNIDSYADKFIIKNRQQSHFPNSFHMINIITHHNMKLTPIKFRKLNCIVEFQYCHFMSS